MSKPKLISPMLDNFDMGDPISEHDGVRCCPAMEKDSDNKYIVKIISTPASQTQLEALLLSGAFPNEEAASAYFKSLSDGIVKEVEALQKLSQFEGFTPFADCQTIPMDDGVGFDVYLISEYRNTLQQHLRSGSLTHLAAINLGLDLCSALAASRRIGLLYVDLKPSNIYLVNDQNYRIGDLGFLSLNSLKYASLPDRYRSEYTAPEISDAFSALNSTIDLYALGLILYQVYNDGVLPVISSSEALVPPAYADYEMAEIILKACAFNPEERWQEPSEMGQALVAYMQRNGANDVPIVPVFVQEDPIQECEETEKVSEESCESEIPEEIADASVLEASNDNKSDDSNDIVLADNAEPSTEETNITENIAESELEVEVSSTQEEAPEDLSDEDTDVTLAFLTAGDEDETLPDDMSDEIADIQISDEVSDILEQADALIAHPTPAPVVQPEAIEVQLPPAVEAEVVSEEAENTTEVETDTADTAEEAISEETPTTDESVEETNSEDASQEAPKKSSGLVWLRNTLIVISVLALLFAGYLFYKNYYLQPIDSITLEDGGNGTLTVYVTSRVDSNLTVICSDTYGNQLFAPVINGMAVFYDLAPNSAYTVKVEISGFHRLTGDTTAAYTTPQQTNIVQFNAVTGAEDGSVILGFTIDGPDSAQWKIKYADDNGALKEVVFSGHVFTINGLTIGNTYAFELEPLDDINITGINSVEHTATAIVKAKSVLITSRSNNSLTAEWSAQENTEVSSWTVRCYGDNGFEQTIITEDTNAVFEIPDKNTDYTVEVTAAGMSVSERSFAPANAVTAKNFQYTDTTINELTVTWDCDDTTANSWILLYTINGSATQEIVCNDTTQTVITPIIPGCEYHLTLQLSDGRPVLGGDHIYNSIPVQAFNNYGVKAEHMEFSMCRTPSYSGWNRYDLSDDDYTTTFEVGEKASFLIRMRHEYNTSSDMITALFVFRNESGAIVWTSSSSSTWTNMWYKNYCELDIPSIPQAPGNYSVSIYFNGALAGESNLTVIAE